MSQVNSIPYFHKSILVNTYNFGDGFTIRYGKYSYSWNLLKEFPKFWLTKRITNDGGVFAFLVCPRDATPNEDTHNYYVGFVEFADVCPEIYAYVHRYITCGSKVNLEEVSKRLLCTKESILELIRRLGFDETICI